MRDLFSVPEIIVEARESALKKAKPGKKPGLIWILSVLITLGVEYLGVGLALVPILVIAVIKAIVSETGGYAFGFSSDGIMMLQLYPLFIITILFILYARFVEKRKARTLGFVKKGFLLQYVIGIIAGFAVFSLAVGIGHLTGAITIASSTDANVVTFILYCGAWIIQGMEEEVVCRGFLMTTLARRYSIPLAVIVNSVFFAAMHLLNPGIGILPFINLTLFGIFASLLFIKTNNIWVCSAVHSVWNLVQGNFYGISVSGNDQLSSFFRTTFVDGKELWNGGAFGLEGGLCVTIVLVLGCVITCLIPGKKNKTAEEE
ncbi:MAG: CPBP family intramembrane metalloprotease [Clostridiales bacterium]|nr:CPBP family intramembrane metalloprotease [Clostridiales bacterium]